MKQIFLDNPEDRMEEIETILKKKGIYSGSDMKILDTNDTQIQKSFSNLEILKIEDYIKKSSIKLFVIQNILSYCIVYYTHS